MISWNEYFYTVNLTTTPSTLPLFAQRFLSFGEVYTAQVATAVRIPVVILGWISAAWCDVPDRRVQARGRIRSPCMPPSTARSVPVVEPERGLAR